MYVSRAAVPVLRRQGGGRIIQNSSLGGRIGSPGMSAYHAAKWAVGGFSESLAAEVAPLGIKVTVLEPGGMRTEWAGSSMSTPPVSEPHRATVGAAAESMKNFAAGADGDPAKVARTVLTVSALDEPPLRLLLGSDSYRYGREAWAGRLEEDEKWRYVSVSTDHDEAEGDGSRWLADQRSD
ncbi:SDR family NAD(P)-dependent oxidoreductase [Streptomyces cyaneofuscatus]|uniref:SDR family NAD(P)-dependent oxidoreductase n=1 Tax=Streptomyces cyaneofuscatus TaxID=66883 RepID=UPI00365E8515